MTFQTNAYITPVLIAGIVNLVVAIVAFRRRHVTAAPSLAGLMAALSFWSFMYAFELATPQLNAQMVFIALEYIGIVAVPPMFLAFTLFYVYPGKINSRHVLPFFIVPGIILLLVWSNGAHGLIWSAITQQDNGQFIAFKPEYGVGFWAWTAYSYALLLTGTVILIRQATRTFAEHRQQAMLVIAATLVTWVGNAIYLTGNSPIPNLDLTPFLLSISGILFAWNLFHGGLLQLLPIAGENILQSLNDAVLVLDDKNRIVFANRAFRFYTHLDDSIAGARIEDAVPNWPALLDLVSSGTTARREIALPLDKQFSIFFDARASLIKDETGRLAGRAFVLDEITERKQSERRLVPEVEEEGQRAADARIPLVFIFRQGDGKVLEVNRAFIVATGFTRNEATGQTLLQLGLWTAEERANFVRELRTRENNLDGYPLTLHTHAGAPLKLTVSAHVARLSNDRFVVIVGQVAA